MTAVNREYRVRVATAGADDVEGNVEFTLDLQDLAEPPVVTGHIPHVLAGATEMRPFNVLVIDHAGTFTAAMTNNGRWVMIGRLIDVGYRDLPSGSWVTYGTGRVSAADESDGPGRYRLEISDESWYGRKARIFDVANTTRLWPAGPSAPWRGFGTYPLATGELISSSGNKHRIVVEARSPNASVGAVNGEILPALIRWADSDIVDEPRVDTPSGGNFTHLRLNYGGTQYPVVGFGRQLVVGDVLDGLKNPDIESADNANRRIRVSVWVYSTSTPAASGAAFLEAPTAPLGGGMVLHLGIADASHEFGSTDGWLHPAELTQRYFDATGQRYNSDSIAAVLADTSLPLLAPRVLERPDDPEKWMQENVWVPLLIVLRDAQGRRKLVNLRMPQDIDPDSLPVIDASNSDKVTWRLSGREAVNSITWKYLHHSSFGPDARDAGNNGDRDLDGLRVDERQADPIEGDTITAMGRRPLTLSLLGALEPSADISRRGRVMRISRGSIFADATASASRELLDIFQDGAFTFIGECGRTLAESLEEGDLALVDLDSLQLPNPGSGARSDLRLVRIMHIAKHPAFGEIEVLDMGPSAQPLGAPSISVARDVTDPDLAHVTISGVPAGATAVVDVGFSDTSTPPSSWVYSRIDLADGVHSFRGLPGVGFVHARAKSVAPQRIRSAWVYAFVELVSTPLLHNVTIELGAEGTPTLLGEWNTAVAGVRVTYAVSSVNPDEDPNVPGDPADSAIADLGTGIVIDTRVRLGYMILARLEPWSGFVDPNVTGTAGPTVDVVAYGTVGDVDVTAPTIEALEVTEVNTAEGRFAQVTADLGSTTASWAAWQRTGANWPTTDGAESGPLDDRYLAGQFPASMRTYRNTIAASTTLRVLALPYNDRGRAGERVSATLTTGSGGTGSEPGGLTDIEYKFDGADVVFTWDVNETITNNPGIYELDVLRDGTEVDSAVNPEDLTWTDPELVASTKNNPGATYREYNFQLTLRDTSATYGVKKYFVDVSGYFLDT